jgi:hypothetical protein
VTRRSEADRVEELARLLDGDIEASEATAGVRSLLLLAETVREETRLERPTDAFRASLREQILADAASFAAATPAVTPRSLRERADDALARVRSSARVAVATATVSGLIGTAGVAAAAQAALPGDALYGVKQATEQFRLAVAGPGVESARVKLQLAHERLSELELGLGTLRPHEVVARLDEMDTLSQGGAEELLDEVARTGDAELAELLRGFSDSQRSRLGGLRDQLAVEVRPRADASLELLRRIEVQLGVASVLECDCPDDATTLGAVGPRAATSVVAPGAGPAVTATDCGCLEAGARTATELPRDPGTRATEPGTTAPADTDTGSSDPQPDGPTNPDTGIVPGPVDTSNDVDPLAPVEQLTEPLRDVVTEQVEDLGDLLR